MVANMDGKDNSAAKESGKDFDSRHEEDLGVKKFTVTQGKMVVIPLLTMGAGALIGYHTLGKPLTKLFPKFFQNADALRDGAHAVTDLVKGEVTEKWNLQTAKFVGAAVLGTMGSILGSVFVGYDKWRKDESTRLAAEDIERDISRMELFKPSDPELVAENKRLRGMLAEAEKKTPAHHTIEEKHHDKPKVHIAGAEYHGKHEERAQQIA